MPPKQEKKVDNPFTKLFGDLDGLIANSVKQEELMDVVKALFDSIEKLESKLAQSIATNKTTTDQSLSAIEDALSNAKDELKEIISGAKEESVKNLAGVITQLRSEINEVRDEIPELPEEKDYSDIFKAFDEKLSKLEMLTLGENVRNALEALPDGEKLAITAIEGLRKELDDIKKLPRGTVSGGVTDKAVQFALMRSIQAVTPSGIIDGVNTDFEVPSTIHAVLSFELGSRVVALGEYSIVGGARRIIRFDTPPPAAYSGKSFVITFI